MKKIVSALTVFGMILQYGITVNAADCDIAVYAEREFIEVTYPYPMNNAVTKLFDGEGNEISIEVETEDSEQEVFNVAGKLDVDTVYRVTVEDQGVIYDRYFCLNTILFDDFESYNSDSELCENWVMSSVAGQSLKLEDGKMLMPALSNAADERYTITYNKDKLNLDKEDYVVEYDFVRRSGYSSNQHFYTLLREGTPDVVVQVGGQGVNGLGVTLSNQFMFNDGGAMKTFNSQYKLKLNGETAVSNSLIIDYQNVGARFHIKSAARGSMFNAVYECMKSSSVTTNDVYEISYEIPSDSPSNKSGYFKLASRAMGGYIDNFLVYEYSEDLSSVKEITQNVLLQLTKSLDVSELQGIIENSFELLGFEDIEKYNKISDKSSVISEIAGNEYVSIQALSADFEEAIDKAYFEQRRAFDSFGYESETQLNSTSAQNGFLTGYKANTELSEELTDNAVAENGFVRGTNALYRGISSADDCFVIIGGCVNNMLADNESIVLGMGDTYFGIKSENGNVYAYDYGNGVLSELEFAESYEIYVVISDNSSKGVIISDNESYTAELNASEKCNYVGILTDSEEGFNICDFGVEFYKNGYASDTESKLNELTAALENGDDLGTVYNTYMSSYTLLYEGMLKELFFGQLVKYDELLKETADNYNLQIAEKFTLDAESDLLYTSYLKATDAVKELENSEGKALLSQRLDALKQIINDITPRILYSTVSGENSVGRILTAEYQLYDKCGNGAGVQIKWYADGEEIGQGEALELSSDLRGKNVRVSVAPVNNSGKLGATNISDEIYIYDYDAAIAAVNDANIYNMGDVLEEYAPEIALDDYEKLRYVNDMKDIYSNMVNIEMNSVEDIKQAFEDVLNSIVKGIVIYPDKNVLFRYSELTDPITEEVNSAPSKLGCDFNARRYSIIGFNLSELSGDEVVKAEFSMTEDYAQDREKLGGKIEIRELGELPSWETDAKTFLSYYDLNMQNPTTKSLGIVDVEDGSVKRTSIDITDYIKQELLTERDLYSFTYVDMAAKSVQFWPMSSVENTPLITVWINETNTIVSKINNADLENIEEVLEYYAEKLNLDYYTEFSLLNEEQQTEILTLMVETEFESAYDITTFFNSKTGSYNIEYVKSENAFDLKSGDMLKDTEAVYGFASGWKNDVSGGVLSSDYTIDNNGYITNNGMMEMFAHTAKKIVPDNGEYYLSAVIKTDGNMQNSDYIAVGFDENIFGISQKDGKIYVLSAPNFTFDYAGVLDNTEEYRVLIRIDSDFNIYAVISDGANTVFASGKTSEERIYAVSCYGQTGAKFTYGDVFFEYHAEGAQKTFDALELFKTALLSGTDKEKFYAARTLIEAKMNGMAGYAEEFYNLYESEYTDDIEFWSKYDSLLTVEELLELAEKSMLYSDYTAAQKAVAEMGDGDKAEALKQRVSALKEKIDKITPQVTARISGNGKVGNTLKAVVSVKDVCGNGVEPELKWYVGNSFEGEGDEFEVTSDCEGKTIYLEVTSVNNAGTKGAAVKSIGIKIEKKSSSSGGGGGGGGGSASLSAPVVTPAYVPEQPATEIAISDELYFNDINEHWAKNEILNLNAKNIVTGRTDNLFCPDENITRAEFTTLVMRLLGMYNTSDVSSFADVASEDWYFDYVEAAYRNGIINGDNGSFYPNNNISREEMAMILSAVLGKYTDVQTTELGFADNSEISDWAFESVKKTVSHGIFKGNDENMFEPKKNATRAEAAVVIYRLLPMIGNAE